MKPDFSEFSYGYAVTEELVSVHKAAIVAAPLFPSLYKEGKAGGGYDVRIPISGTPVFLQFKLSDQLERTNAKEYRNRLLTVPYYRMHLRPNKHSDQHNLLLDLEAKGESVFYIAPEFHLLTEMNFFYLNRTIVSHSAAFTPKAIGQLPDDEEHYVAFERGASVGYFCSDKPMQVGKISLREGLRTALVEHGVKARRIGEDGLHEISHRMLGVLTAGEKRLSVKQKTIGLDGVRKIVETRNSFESIGYMAKTFFGAELLIFD